MYQKILELNPGHKKPNFNSWANVIRLTIQEDGRSLDAIKELFTWANQDHFWKKNILSPDSLRKQWDRLTIEKSNPKTTGPPKPLGRIQPAKTHNQYGQIQL